MTRKTLAATALAALLAGGAAYAADTDTTPDRDRDRIQDQDRTQDRDRDRIQDRDIYGSQLMTSEEREEYRERMRTATSAEERERIRAEHHERMTVRAREQGITLPDRPPERPQRMGPGGMGPGGGRGMNR